MRVFGPVLVVAGLLSALVPSAAGAAPIVVDPVDCTAVLGRTNSDCTLYDLGSIEGLSTIDLTFESYADVAVFAFSVSSDSTFFAQTSSVGLDSMLALFDDERSVYAGAPELAFGTDNFSADDDQLGGFVLTGGTTYYLAVLLTPIFNPDVDDPFTFVSNGFNGTLVSPFGSLEAEFGCEATNAAGGSVCAGAGGTFSLQLSATAEGGEPVPEPGTLVLLGSGVLAAVIRGRTKKRI
jgi:hypothetical protein